MSTSNNSNQQTLADSGANERPQMLERGNYIPWESRFKRFFDNKLEEGVRMWNSIQNGPYVRPMIPNPDGAVNINGTDKSKNHKKTVKNEQARIRESEEYKAKARKFQPHQGSCQEKSKFIIDDQTKIKRTGEQGKRLEGSKAAYK
ncbi:hypothetical protein Tco_1516528 [Tanacetum coccineum]